MYKLTFKKRVWVIKQYEGGLPVARIAACQSINRRTVYKILEAYKEYGRDGLKDHITGRPETVLNSKMEIIILDLRKQYQYGACRIEQVLKKKGFSISHRQIEKVLLRNNMVVANVKKQKPRKWVRYELPHPNDLWHTDWTHCPFTDKEMCAYIDDRTRLITAYAIFKSATTNNSLAALKTGIQQFGKPKAVMTDHGSQFYANHPNANQENHQFRITLNALSIKHYLARVNRPQTNGKIERFFGTYKREFLTGSFSCLKDYIKHYNEQRPHMSLHYKTPKDIWDELTVP